MPATGVRVPDWAACKVVVRQVLPQANDRSPVQLLSKIKATLDGSSHPEKFAIWALHSRFWLLPTRLHCTGVLVPVCTCISIFYWVSATYDGLFRTLDGFAPAQRGLSGTPKLHARRSAPFTTRRSRGVQAAVTWGHVIGQGAGGHVRAGDNQGRCT